MYNEHMNEIKVKKSHAELVLRHRDGTVFISKFSLEDLEKVQSKKWITSPSHKQQYVRSTQKYGSVLLHKVLTAGRVPIGFFTDHINGDTLDNRRKNLRAVNRYQNGWNMKLRTDNTTGTKQVTWHPNKKKWQARISVAGKRLSLGYFSTKEEAVDARMKAEKRLHGSYSRKI